MLTDNIFKLLKKTSKDEDQLSSAFGFLLKEDTDILKSFLHKLGISITRSELKNVDIEILVPYGFEGKQSFIDLHIEVPGKFLIFLESKIVPTSTESILRQIKKYNDILRSREAEYKDGTHLVYVAPYPISIQQIEFIAKQLKRSAKEFLFFSWENLLDLTSTFKRKNKRIVELFKDYIGDTMYKKKIIEEQKVKNISDVLVIFTTPYFWELSLRKNIAVQKKSSPDARYIAFLRTHLPKREKSAITHIAEVEYTELRPRKDDMLTGLDKKTNASLIKHLKERNADITEIHKVYVLKKGSLKELPQKIDHYGPGPQVKFSATMSDLLCARTTQDIKKGKAS